MKGVKLSEELENAVGMIIPTEGLLMYICNNCEEEYAGHPEEEEKAERNLCGICQMEYDSIIRMENPNEHEYDPKLDD